MPAGQLHPRLRPDVDRGPGLIAPQEAGDALLLGGSEGRLELDLLERLREAARAAGVVRGLVLEKGLDVRAMRVVAEAGGELRKAGGRLARKSRGERATL